jgi:hypothetical protein
MTLGYKFSFSIYSLIHQVLEKVGSFVAFAQTPSFHLFFSSAYSPFRCHSIYFLLFIYYSTAVTTILFSLYLTWDEPFSVVSLLVGVAIFWLIFQPSVHPMPVLP